MERGDEALVEAIAQEYAGRCSMGTAKLVAVGLAGLARGREKLPEGGIEDTRAYLEWWVRWAITKEIAERADTRAGGVPVVSRLPRDEDGQARPS